MPSKKRGFFLKRRRGVSKSKKRVRKDKTEGENKIGEREFTGRPPCHPWGDYAEELIPLLLVGRRSETDPGSIFS
jgi:hypothetical protein